MRYWAIPGEEGLCHRVGGLEKDYVSGALSNNPENHERMVKARAQKVANVANHIPELEVKSEGESDTLLVGWGGTYGHLYTAYEHLNARCRGRRTELLRTWIPGACKKPNSRPLCVTWVTSRLSMS